MKPLSSKAPLVLGLLCTELSKALLEEPGGLLSWYCCRGKGDSAVFAVERFLAEVLDVEA